MALRDYQERGLSEIRQAYSKGIKKVLLYMATGSGKTATFSEVLKGLHAKGNTGIVVVRGRKLVDQASLRLAREGVPHGVFMAGHKSFNPNFPIQVASIDTLRARGIRPRASLIVVDEAHMATSQSFRDFLNYYKDAFILAVTATPFTKKPLRHIGDVIVSPINISGLLSQGFLVDGKYYAPRTPKLDNVEISKSTGDYDTEQLNKVMKESVLVGDTVSEWKRLGENRSTLVFCCTVEHSKQVCQAFNDAGIPAEHIDANINDRERDVIIDRLEKGITKVITSIGTMTTGVDIPSLGCLVFARPTRSFILYVQMLGRGTRPHPGKNDFIVLDHAGNLMRHGCLRDIDSVDPTLDGKPESEKAPPVMTCPECFSVFSIQPWPCPSCGHKPEDKPENNRKLNEIDGTLEAYSHDPVMLELIRLKETRKQKKFHTNWIWHKLSEKFGVETANKYFPVRKTPKW
jgi:DNA repair protein RadD